MKTRLFLLFLLALALQVVGPAGLRAPSALAQPTPSITDSYRLGSADKVRVTVFGEEGLSGEFLVSGDGKVAMPLVGDIAAAGLTLSQFQTNVENALKDGYLHDPRVSVEVLNYRPFYILGEVMNPGEYPYVNSLTVLNAVATAGGFTYRAAKDRVYIKRSGDGDERREPLTPGTRVWPGDTIRIGERLF